MFAGRSYDPCAIPFVAAELLANENVFHKKKLMYKDVITINCAENVKNVSVRDNQFSCEHYGTFFFFCQNTWPYGVQFNSTR